MNIVERDINDPSCQIKIYAMSMGDAAQALVAPDGNGSEIRINELSLWRTDQDYWNELLGHEWGHLFGLENVTVDGCGAYTIMHRSEYHGSLPGTPLCSDQYAIAAAYAQTSNDDSEYSEPSEAGENCWDVYWVHVTWYIWSDGSVTQGPSWTLYLGTECEDLE
jgi:hypothetical protein